MITGLMDDVLFEKIAGKDIANADRKRSFILRTYTVVPNVDVTGWFVKLEDVAPEEVYDTKAEAIEAAESMAKENTPSLVEILDKNHDVEEEKHFKGL